MRIRAAVVTVSDRSAAGRRPDRSGPVVADLLRRELSARIVARRLVPDRRAVIRSTLCELAGKADLIVTTGGTGLSPRDVTPEATREVIDREVPGLAEVMRAAGLQHTPYAALSRGVAGTIGRTLVLNLPGSPRGAAESLSAVLEVLPHAISLLTGEDAHHADPPSPSSCGGDEVPAG